MIVFIFIFYFKLSFSVSDIPFPSVEWRFNDVIVTSRPGLRLVDKDQVVEIDSVQVTDEGRFQCVAINDAGIAVKAHTVVVYGMSLVGA